MNFLPAIPDPLHPALVHFPIVLILLGTMASVLAVFWRKGYVPAFAAALLVMGALGAWAAVASGKSDGGLVENTSAGVETLLEAHENWAERTLTAAVKVRSAQFSCASNSVSTPALVFSTRPPSDLPEATAAHAPSAPITSSAAAKAGTYPLRQNTARTDAMVPSKISTIGK